MENNQDYSYLDLPTQRKESVVAPIVEDLRVKNPIDGVSSQATFSVNFGSINNTGVDKRIQTFDNTTKFLDVYKPLSSGDTVAMYDTYVPRIDNMEYNAQQQSTGEKWANGALKFGTKTLSAVVGGTAGLVYGVEEALTDGKFSSLYDNDFSNWLNDLDTKLNYQLPNYYTKQEQEAGVFGQMGTANFWSDKFLGGLSFTTGAIISEGIWAWATGGTSLASVGARVGGKLAGLGRAGRWSAEAIGEANTIAAIAKTKGLYKALYLGKDAVNLTDDVLRARQFAVAGGRFGQVASIVGRTARSAGYEASVEALQYKKEAEEKFYSTFADLNGREPNAEEISAFEKENESTANAVFGANMAIVGTSNLIGLGHVLNIKNPVNLGISDFINKKAFGYGIDSATKQVVKGSTKQIIARNAFDYLIKPSVTEGLFEEGLQGVTNKTANKWIEHTYNPKYTNETFSQMEAFIGSLDEQYGSEEGWKDNILGMLIGVAGGSVNVKGEQKAKEAELDMKASVDRTYDTKTLQGLILPHRIQTANRISAFTEEANTEEAKGNLAKSQIAKIGATTSYINSKLVLGESISDMTQEMQGALNSMTSEQWKELGVEQDQIEQEKTDRISEFKSLAQNWKTNKDYVQYMVGSKMVGEQNLEGIALEEVYGKFSKNAQIVEALTWQLTVGEQSGKIVETVKNKVGSELGTEHARTMETIEKLDQQSTKQKRRVSSLRAVAKKNRENRDRFTKEIVNLDKAEQTDGTKQRRLSLTQKLLESENKLAESLQALDGIANDINATKNYQSDLDTININQNILTGQDLLELDENINKFKSVVEQQEQLDPQRASYLKDLMQEHAEAYSMFMQAKATQKALTSKEFKVTNIDGWVDNLFKKNKSMSENTQAWFTEAITNYGDFKRKLISGGLENQPTAEEIKLEEELQSGEISQETLQSIADKTTLSKAEQIIYNDNKEAIDELRKQNNLKTKPKSQEQINQEKIAELEQQRLAELSEVEPITIKERIEAEPITQTVKDTKAEQELLDKKQKVEAELTSLGATTGGSEAKKADIERRRQENLELYDKRDLNSLEAIMPNNPNHKKNGLGISVGDKFNQGQKIIVVNSKPDENYDGKENPYEVITKVIEPQLHDASGKMIQTGKVEVTLFNNKEEADAAIQANYEKIKSLQGKKQNNINAKYDAELKALEQLNTSNDISDDVYNKFIDEGVVPTTIINSIAKKVKNQEKLTERETAIFTDKTSEINNAITKLVDVTEVILPSKYNDKGNKYTLRDGKWQSQLSTGEWVTPSKKELEEIEQKLSESPNQVKIDELNKELEDINAQLENIPTIQQEIKQEPTFTEREVPNQAQIDKINKKYDEKINTLRPKAKDLVDEYKQRIDKMFNEIYDDLIPTEDLEAQRPTKEEIEEYKNTTNRRTKRFQELKKKLQNWQLLDASSDDGYTSIVDLLDLIAQLETEVEQEDTKDTVTEEEAVEYVANPDFEDVSNPDFGEGSNSSDEKSIPNNSTEPVVAHKIKDTTKIELSHVKARYIVEQVGGGYTITRNGKTIPNSNIDNLEVGDIVSIDGMQFSMEENYRLSFEEEDLNSRQQQLNLYVEASQNYLNFLSVYSIFGDERIKTPSQFIDDKLNREASFNVKPGDILTLHVDDSDNWNKSKKGSTQDEFKIYLKDKDGKYVSVLKSGKAKYGSPFNEVYANIRLRAFQNWEAQGMPDKMDLGISIKVDSVLLTAPELLYSDGKLVDGDISIEETQKVILGKGFIENGEFTLDTVKAFDKSKVSKAYVGKLTKNNPNLKIPVVVFQVGENIVAFPITMKKSANPIEFDSLLQGTPQEIVKKINQGIIDNRLRVNKLTFSDVSIDYNGEVILSELAQKVREAFINKTSFVSADTLADKNYKVENLVRDASIRINLSDVKKVFSAPKIRLDLDSAEISQIRAVKYDNMTDIENALSDIALELDRHWRTNAETLYVIDKKGTILEDVPYTNTLDNNPPKKVTQNTDAQYNVKVIRNALTNKNGEISVADLPFVVKKAIGLQKLKEAENLLKQYDSIKAQTIAKEEEVDNGLDNIDDSCNG